VNQVTCFCRSAPMGSTACEICKHDLACPVHERACPQPSNSQELVHIKPNIYDQLDIPESDRLTSIRKDQAEYMYEFVSQIPAYNTLETGFAYGCSAAHIISAKHKNGFHTVIDPNQESKYNNIGFRNLVKLRLATKIIFRNTYSYLALPDMVAGGQIIDFAFLDGSHLFEDILLDFYYSAMMLTNGGYIMFDDAWMKSVVKVAQYIVANRKDFTLIPRTHHNVIVFQKIGSDEREWNHFEPF